MWVANTGSNTVEKIRASDGALLATYTWTGHNASGLAYDGARIWVADHNSNTVTALNARDGTTAPYCSSVIVGQNPNAMAWEGWGMWVTSRQGKVSLCSQQLVQCGLYL